MSRLSMGNACCSESLKLLFSCTWLSWESRSLIFAFCCKYVDKTVLKCGFSCWNLACHTEGRICWVRILVCELWFCVVWCSTFWKNVVSTSSLVSIPRSLTLDGEGTIVSQTSGTAHQRTQCHIPEDLNFQQHHSENLISCSIKEISEADAMGSVWV